MVNGNCLVMNNPVTEYSSRYFNKCFINTFEYRCLFVYKIFDVVSLMPIPDSKGNFFRHVKDEVVNEKKIGLVCI